ncbi:MAG: hypothetical protein AABY15_07035 [Nanoarchaeota archaeon]
MEDKGIDDFGPGMFGNDSKVLEKIAYYEWMLGVTLDSIKNEYEWALSSPAIKHWLYKIIHYRKVYIKKKHCE